LNLFLKSFQFKFGTYLYHDKIDENKLNLNDSSKNESHDCQIIKCHMVFLKTFLKNLKSIFSYLNWFLCFKSMN